MTENYYIDRSDNSHRISGLIATLLFHGLIILSLVMVALYPPDPPLESQGGMMMGLGDENMGGPSESPVANPQPNEQYTPISEQTDDQTVSSEDPEAVAIKDKKTDKENPKKNNDQVKPTQENKPPVLELPKKVNQQALFRRNGNSNGQSGYGDGDLPGNQGAPNGDPNGGNGNGEGDSGDGIGKGPGGHGTGYEYDLDGRKMKTPPVIEDNSRAVGKVVVRIVVDKDGNVIRAVPGQVGSTTTDPGLLAKAKDGALRTKFNSQNENSGEQHGTMTIYFKYKP